MWKYKCQVYLSFTIPSHKMTIMYILKVPTGTDIKFNPLIQKKTLLKILQVYNIRTGILRDILCRFSLNNHILCTSCTNIHYQ